MKEKQKEIKRQKELERARQTEIYRVYTKETKRQTANMLMKMIGGQLRE